MPPALEQQAELAAACLRAVAENSAALASIKAAAAASRQAGWGQAAATGQPHSAGAPPPRLPIEQLVKAFVQAIFETQARSVAVQLWHKSEVLLAGCAVPGMDALLQHTSTMCKSHKPEAAEQQLQLHC